MQQRNIFAGPYLDRAAHLRQDPVIVDYFNRPSGEGLD